jgi:hypothetical protein
MHAGAAITAPNAGAFLTGLATAVVSVPAGISCPRRYHCPFVGCLLSVSPELIGSLVSLPSFRPELEDCAWRADGLETAREARGARHGDVP